ncbi:MAG: hypothetical protein NWT08_02055 [Akkermansiaceae bacterium]|jgi:hypothetical protein|nr:hypothetical protein [Akkermansiaceae bacterium]MDP4720648.1 hypothetical protein [Akkermansiaceae bacterium]MDP4779100.1 hypothetical protein [Akkermansiaceae bacterium]MDP4848247.1 hypothetical protein [Akkermansiaceae bacterium]MDP4896181.1 hypothetical protein [Akkermansiaceae bacterium]
MREIRIHRPITAEKLSDAISRKPYQIVAILIRCGIFPAPHDSIKDAVAIDIVARAGLDLKILDNEAG